MSYQWRKNGSSISGATRSAYTISPVQATDAGTYSAKVSNAGGSVTSSGATLTVLIPPTITTQPQNQTATLGGRATFSVVASGTAPLGYQWYFNGTALSGATSSALTVSNVQVTNSYGSFYVTVSNVAGTVYSASAALTVNVPPTITSQPQSQTVTLTPGQNVTFSVGTSGTTPLSYQWKFNGAALAGATNALLQLNNIQATNAGSYTAVVTNVAGSATSAVATLTVLVLPAITTQPQSHTTVVGQSTSFSVAASGTAPLSYQWNFNSTTLSGATNATLTLSNPQLTDAGSYTVVVTNGAGSVTSAVAALTVYVPPAITTQPQSQTVTQGVNVAFSVMASGTTPLSYKWSFNGTAVSGATSSALALSNVQTTDAGSYTVIVTNVVGSVTSAVAALTVLVPPAIQTQPTNLTVMQSLNAAFSVVASGTAPRGYQWSLNGVALSGATKASLALSNVQPAQVGGYSVVITNSSGSVTSAVATLAVIAVPPGSYVEAVITNRPLAFWRLDELSGTTAFDYVGGNNATYANVTLNRPGALATDSDTAASFNGTNSYAGTGVSLANNCAAFTLEGWYKLVAGSTRMGFWGQNDAIEFGLSNPNTIQIWTPNGGSLSVANTWGTNSWHYLAAVGNGANLRLYVDGNLAGSGGSATANYGSSSYPFNIGGGGIFDATTNWFNGCLDEVAFYDRALAATDIKRHYLLGLALPALTLTAPTNNATFTAPETINLAATVVTNGHTITKVQFFNGATLLTEDLSAPYTYTWSGAGAGTYNVSAVAIYDSGSVTSSVATVTVFTPPAITTQPLSQTVTQGLTASLSVVASGTAPLSYQWQYLGYNVDGATDATLVLTNMQLNQAGNYSVMVSNVAGTAVSAQAFLTVIPPPGNDLPVMQGLVAHLTFDTDLTDSSGRGNHAAAVGAPNLVPGFVGAGAFNPFTDANGTNNYATLGTDSDFTFSKATNFSIAFWARLPAGGWGGRPSNSDPPFVSNKDWSSGANVGWVVATGNDGRLQWNYTEGGNQNRKDYDGPAGVFGNPVWHHVAVTFQRTQNAITYFDGVPVSTNSIGPGTKSIDSGLPTNIGNDGTGNYSTFYGYWTNAFGIPTNGLAMDDLGIWRRVVSAKEICAIYNAGLAGQDLATVTSANLTTAVLPRISQQPVSLEVIAGSPVTFSVTASGPAPFGCQWFANGISITGATGPSLALSNVQPAQAGSYFVVLTNSAASLTSAVATLTVDAPPSITAPPESQTVTLGQSASFSIVATGTGLLGYQWLFNGTPLLGATTAALALTNVQATDAGSYTAVVTNSWGSVTSAVATLTVNIPPVITTQPQSLTVIQGNSASFSIVASGTAPLGYQWSLNGTDLPGATSSTLTLNNVQPTDAGGSYAAVVTNVAGSVTSAVATLTVLVPPGITTQPQNQTVIQDNSASFSVVASGTTPFTYQWYFNGSSLGGGAQSSTLTLNAVAPSNAGNYSVVVANAGGSVTSVVATLTVLVPPGIQTQPNSQTVTQGQNASFSVVANGSALLSYQWSLNTTALLGATSSTLTLTNAQTTDAGSYMVVVTNAAGSVTSAVATLTVLVPPGITTRPQSLTVTQGQSASFSVVASGTAPLSYQWSFNSTALSGATSTTLTLTNAQATDTGNYTVVVTNVAGSVTSAVATLTVTNPAPPAPPSLGAAGMTTNGFTFQLSVSVGQTYVILATTNLRDWTPISTNVALLGTILVTDTEATNYSSRLYRVILR
jgi:hypothetical protein